MRKVLISLLLASAVASPALAARPNWPDHHPAQDDRQSNRDERPSVHQERSSTNENDSRSNRSEQRNEARQQQAQPQQQSFERRSNFGGVQNAEAAEAFRQRQQAAQNGRQERLDRQVDLRQVRDTNRELRRSTRSVRAVLPVSNTPRPGTQPPLQVERNHAPIQWSSNWRHDSKYDWQNYRHHHRSHFHLGFYYDPFGWGYSPFQIGWRLWPAYYGSNYWLNDPWSYRLPYAPPGTRWIRYYDDAILVDIWSGQVVDVIYDFFW